MMESVCLMPKYQCHKKVWALKISDVFKKGDGSGGAVLTTDESGYAPIHVDAEYMAKHQPKAGGYYVVYEDGYKSFSPADAFEGGYTRL